MSVTLRVTSFASGDNYQVEASANESFSCGLSCAKSAVYTAWKRVYVEYNKMFRRGAFLSDDVASGAREIPVDDTTGLPKPPFEIRLLHAAKVSAPSEDFATEERVTIVEIRNGGGLLDVFSFGPRPGTLILSSDAPGLQRAYSGPEEINKILRGYLADGVGVVTGLRATDFLLVNGTAANALFDQAFAEYVWMTDAAASDGDLLFTQPRVPYDGVLPRNLTPGGEGIDSWQREWLTRKWLRSASRNGIDRIAKRNHQALFTTGSFWKQANDPATNYGVTTVASNFNDTWLPVKTVGNHSLGAETLTHELAHQWRVNHDDSNPKATGGHCGAVRSGDGLLMTGQAAKYCTMTSDVYEHPEAADGTVGLHYVKFGEVIDSEYLHIRRRPDPIPQTANMQRATPQ